MLAAKIYLVCLGIGVLLFSAFPAEDTYVYPTTVQEIQTERIETVVQNETGSLALAVRDMKSLAAKTSNTLQLEAQTNMAQAVEIQDLKALVAQLSNDLQMETQARLANSNDGALSLAASACNGIELERQERVGADLAIHAAVVAAGQKRELDDSSLLGATAPQIDRIWSRLDLLREKDAAQDKGLKGVASGHNALVDVHNRSLYVLAPLAVFAFFLSIYCFVVIIRAERRDRV